MKAVMHGRPISLSSFYLKQKREYKHELLRNIKELEHQHKTTCISKVYKRSLEERKKLDALELNSIQQKILRLNQKYWLQSPKTLKLLAWRVKTKRASAQIHTVQDAAGRKQTSTPDILKAFRRKIIFVFCSKFIQDWGLLGHLFFPLKIIKRSHNLSRAAGYSRGNHRDYQVFKK